MSRRSWLPLVAVVLVMACASTGRAADEVRDGAKFNNPDPGHTIYVRSFLTGAMDSAVTVYPTKALPLPMTVGGVVRADTSSKALTMTSSGSLSIDDGSRDRDYRIWTTPVQDSTASFVADSTVSGPFYTAQMARMWLRIQVTWPRSTDANTNLKSCSFAVQVRAHLTQTTDSLSTNPWWIYSDTTRVVSLPNAVANTYRMVADSTNQQSVWQTKALPTEMAFFATRGQVRGVGAGTLAPFQMPEYYGEPANFWIPLADARGVYFWAPYTSIRIRTMSNNSNAAPQYVVDLVGVAK